MKPKVVATNTNGAWGVSTRCLSRGPRELGKFVLTPVER